MDSLQRLAYDDEGDDDERACNDQAKDATTQNAGVVSFVGDDVAVAKVMQRKGFTRQTNVAIGAFPLLELPRLGGDITSPETIAQTYLQCTSHQLLI